LKKRLSKSLYTPEWEALCVMLKGMRKAKGLTQSQLSFALDQPQSFVQKVETGERKLDLRQFVLYVRALNSDPIRAFRLFIEAVDGVEKKHVKGGRQK
jgi:transcriptional regulator with XRE-family HTH domain